MSCHRAALRAAPFLVVLALLAAGLAQSAHAMRLETLKLITARGAQAIDVEVTETPAEKAQGLMFRTRLPDTSGMLFFYETPQEITMWMRNTYIPLDMVFIRADGVVHRIEARTEPLSENIIASQGRRHRLPRACRRRRRAAGPEARRPRRAPLLQADGQAREEVRQPPALRSFARPSGRIAPRCNALGTGRCQARSPAADRPSANARNWLWRCRRTTLSSFIHATVKAKVRRQPFWDLRCRKAWLLMRAREKPSVPSDRVERVETLIPWSRKSELERANAQLHAHFLALSGQIFGELSQLERLIASRPPAARVSGLATAAEIASAQRQLRAQIDRLPSSSLQRYESLRSALDAQQGVLRQLSFIVEQHTPAQRRVAAPGASAARPPGLAPEARRQQSVPRNPDTSGAGADTPGVHKPGATGSTI